MKMVIDKYTNSPWYKYVIFAVNAVFLLFGILLILWGALTIRGAGDFVSVDNAISTASLPVLGILLGFGILVVAALGVVGTITENFYVTATYSVLLLIVTILQIVLVLWTFFQRENFIQAMDDAVENSFSLNNKKNGWPFDPLELTFDCCGYISYQDYLSNEIPNACCGFSRSSKNQKCKKADYAKRPGCKAAFAQFWATNINIVRYVGILVVLLEIVILLLAITLVRKFRNSGTANLEQEQQQQQTQQQQFQS